MDTLNTYSDEVVEVLDLDEPEAVTDNETETEAVTDNEVVNLDADDLDIETDDDEPEAVTDCDLAVEADDLDVETDDDSEIICDSEETAEDKKRDEAVSKARKTADSAHKALDIKMPYFKDRESFRSVVYRFAKANRNYVDSKYSSLDMSNLNDALAHDLFESTLNNIQAASERIGSKQSYKGFADSGKGYQVFRDF